MKRLVKILAAVTAAASLVISVPKITAYADGYTCVHGYRTFGDYTLNSGVRNRYYLIERSLYSESHSAKFGTAIGKAFGDWNTATSKVSVQQIYENDTRTPTFRFAKGNLASNVFAETLFYQTLTLPSPMVTIDSSGKLTGNYSWTRINLNTAKLGSSTYLVQDVWPIIEHEIGHAMGLSHRNNRPSSIMCQTASGRTATAPAAIDVSTVNHLYQ